MLSHDEDRHLKAIEQWLETDDPALARMLRNLEAPSRFHQHNSFRVGVDLLGGLLFLIGALVGAAVVVVIGTAVVAAGVCLHLAAHHQSTDDQHNPDGQGTSAPL